MNSKKDNKNFNNNENISSLANTKDQIQIINEFFKIISKFSSSYFNSIKEWKEFPIIKEIKDEIKIRINFKINIINK